MTAAEASMKQQSSGGGKSPGYILFATKKGISRPRYACLLKWQNMPYLIHDVNNGVADSGGGQDVGSVVRVIPHDLDLQCSGTYESCQTLPHMYMVAHFTAQFPPDST